MQDRRRFYAGPLEKQPKSCGPPTPQPFCMCELCEKEAKASDVAIACPPHELPGASELMPKNTFAITMTFALEIDEALLTAVDTAEWRAAFYQLCGDAEHRDTRREAIAEHLAFNLIQGRALSTLDGFADQPETAAAVDFKTVEVSAHSC